MSAVMSTLSIISGGRRAHRKLANSSRKSGQFSDAGDERSRSHNDLKQRSASMQTLETAPNGGVVNLECLEAKMASIEVSLASSRRRSSIAREQCTQLDALRNALQDKDALIQSLKTQLSASLSAARLAAQAASPLMKRGRDDVTGPLSAEERRALEERAQTVKADLEIRKSNISDLRRRLEKTHVTENIDSRIQQAELQYKLGREELELLTLTEQARVLRALIQHAHSTDNATMYSTLRGLSGEPVLVATEAQEGTWGASVRAGPGLYVQWAREHTALKPGDRLVEVNGVSVLSCRSQEELQRALGCTTSAATLVLLRTRQTTPKITKEVTSLRAEVDAMRSLAEEAARDEQRLKADNTRLTHRISYLEEQVAELLPTQHKVHSTSGSNNFIKATVNKTKKNVTNISITSEPTNKTSKSEVQVFQKGPDITAIVAKLPGLEADATPPTLRPRSRVSQHNEYSRHNADYSAHYEQSKCAEDVALRLLRRGHRRTTHDDIERAADRIEESIKKTNWAERKTLSIIEQLKKSQRLRKLKKNDSAEDIRSDMDGQHMCTRIDGKVLENAHKSSRRFSKHTRSARSSEFESECSDYLSGDTCCNSPRTEARPTPPRKPLRLSLHKARSAHSLINGSESEPPTTPRPSSELKEFSKKPVKRTHAADRWPKTRDTGKATPRPSRKLLNGFSACETPAADDLYPEDMDLHTSATRWC